MSGSNRREKSGPNSHSVHFYDDDLGLAKTVGEYLRDGLSRGEGLVVIATPEHSKAFVRELEAKGVPVTDAMRSGHLITCDAGDTLARFMVDGQPDPLRFENTVGDFIRRLRARAGGMTLRAYGEMVDLLWNAGRSSAASRLEQLWNGLLRANRFSLLCAYQIDVFGKEFRMGVLDEVLCAHTELVPAATNGNLDDAVNTAIDEVLGTRAEGLKPLIKANFRPSWPVIPHAEATVLWLRNNLPDYADEVLARARGHYQASLNEAI